MTDPLSIEGNVNVWVGVDLDGTCSEYGDFRGPTYIGDPVPLMIEIWDDIILYQVKRAYPPK